MSSEFTFTPDLVEDLAMGKVVPFVGAGVTRSSTPKDGLPYKGWAEFLQAASDDVQELALRETINNAINAKDFLVASELLRQEYGEQWGERLSNEYQRVAECSELHKAIFDLKQRIIVTTNFDKLLERMWLTAPTLERAPSVISQVDENAFKLFRDNNSYIIKLHGTIDIPEKVVFDKSSYQKDAFSNFFYNTLISTLLLTHTFLFLGFSMDDPAISMLLEAHSFRYQTSRPHYIFLPGPGNPSLDILTRKLKKLYVIRYNHADNHKELVKMIRALAQAANEKRKEIFAGTTV